MAFGVFECRQTNCFFYMIQTDKTWAKALLFFKPQNSNESSIKYFHFYFLVSKKTRNDIKLCQLRNRSIKLTNNDSNSDFHGAEIILTYLHNHK